MLNRPILKKIAYVAPVSLPSPKDIVICQRLYQDLPEPVDFQGIDSLQELFHRMSDPNWHADFAVVDIQECHKLDGVNTWDLINCLTTLSKLQVKVNGKKRTHLIAGMTENTPLPLVKQALKCRDFSGFTTILGDRWIYEIVLDSISKYIQFDWTIPQVIKDMVGDVKEKKSSTRYSGLTPRELEIYKLLTTRGASNKVIAKTLNIAESTVKIHMSSILKKYNCRNRTQLSISQELS